MQACPDDKHAAMAPVRILTWNILRSDLLRLYSWPWLLRRTALKRALQTHDFDVLCVQEEHPVQRGQLQQWLPGFTVIGDFAQQHGEAIEANGIYFSQARFTAIASGTLRIPVAATHGPLERTATWVQLCCRESRQTFVVANCHFGHSRGGREHDREALCAELARCGAGLPLVLLGDFNCGPADPLFAAFAGLGLARIPQLQPDRAPRTLNLFGLPLWSIDAVLTRELRARSLSVVRGWRGPVVASDHFGLLAEVECPEAPDLTGQK